MTEQVLTWQGPRAVPAPLRPTKAQSPGSFEELAREFEPLLYRTAMFLCRDAADARDLVQETFESGLRDFAQFRPGSSFRSWLSTILHHRFLDRCRARARAREAQRTPLEEIEETVPMEEPHLERGWERVTHRELLRAVDRLDDGFREVFELVAFERLTQKEAGARLGIPPSTVGTRFMRAKAKLRDLLLGARSRGDA